MPVDLDATLYRFHDTVTVLAPGFGVKTRHDAHLTVDDDGVVQATKFGLEPASPHAQSSVETQQEKFSGEEFFTTKDCTLRVYTANATNDAYIPTTLGERFKFDDYWCVYDEDTDYIYEVWRDDLNDTVMIVSIGKETSVKITADKITNRLETGRYTPVMKVGQS